MPIGESLEQDFEDLLNDRDWGEEEEIYFFLEYEPHGSMSCFVDAFIAILDYSDIKSDEHLATLVNIARALSLEETLQEEVRKACIARSEGDLIPEEEKISSLFAKENTNVNLSPDPYEGLPLEEVFVRHIAEFLRSTHKGLADGKEIIKKAQETVSKMTKKSECSSVMSYICQKVPDEEEIEEGIKIYIVRNIKDASDKRSLVKLVEDATKDTAKRSHQGELNEEYPSTTVSTPKRQKGNEGSNQTFL